MVEINNLVIGDLKWDDNLQVYKDRDGIVFHYDDEDLEFPCRCGSPAGYEPSRLSFEWYRCRATDCGHVFQVK